MATANRSRVVVVTGASRGLGRSIALCFGRAGDRVTVNYVAAGEMASDVVNDIISSGGEAVSFRADVRKQDEVHSLFANVVERWGAVDILINNAGVTKDSLLLRMKEQDWDDVLDTNLKGAFHCIRSASDIMAKQQSGHIVNIASITGVQGREGQANYSASKAGLIGLTRASARELGRFNIQVNAVLPGYLPTDMADELSQVMESRILRENALHRVSDPDEVARFIHHLSLMNNVSGQVFNLDSRIL
jgi:3-oxoacyl-[acyl-carrier protein] reductase